MCVLIAGATEYVKFFISVLMLCDMVWSYVVSLSEVIRAAAETSLLNQENKYLDVTFVLDECKLFSALKGFKHPTNNKKKCTCEVRLIHRYCTCEVHLIHRYCT